MTNHDYEIPCPMPECYDHIYLTWSAAVGLAPDDLAPSALQLRPLHSATESWQVECAAGHVLLIPGDPGCGCDDPESVACKEMGHDPEDFDWSEDYRTFRPHDAARLADVVARISA